MMTQAHLATIDAWTETASPTSRVAYLVQVHPGGAQMGARHALGRETIILGRGEDCDVFVDDPAVSRLHARIGMRGERFYVHDLHSTNGTCVNDEPAYLRVLEHGDLLRLGEHVFRFECEESAATSDQRA